MTIEQAIDFLNDTEKQLYALNYAANSVYLDSVTTAPSHTFEGRGAVFEVLSAAEHRLNTDPKLQEALATLSAEKNTDPDLARRVVLMQRSLETLTKIPVAEYAAFGSLVNDATAVWEDAKTNNDFASFAPYLEKLVDMQKRFADYTRPAGMSRYDKMLDTYEKGLTTETLDGFFGCLRERLTPLIAAVAEKGNPPMPDFLKGPWSVDRQRVFSDRLMDLMGIDRRHCGIGETMHPFTLEFNKDDVRITTHYYEDDLLNSAYSVIHEGGHALYELNGSAKHMYTCLAGGISAGVHECQSRLYENIIGRSRPFADALLPILRECFPGRFEDVTADALYHAYNRCRPSLIRTEADELTYPMHIILRYNIERAMINDDLPVKDVPELWRVQMKELLGIVPDNDTVGVLQDSHWSGGSFGYFPSYALGSAYGAQLIDVINRDLNVDETIRSGRLDRITAWLTEHIFRFGSAVDPTPLMESCFGGKFDPTFYTDYLTKKYSELYNIQSCS